MPYYLIPILTYLAFLFEKPGKKNILYKIFLGSAISMVIFMVGFRSPVTGTDTPQYIGYFSQWVPKIEPGFNVLALLFRTVGANFTLFFTIYIIVTLTLRYLAFKRMSHSVAISLMVTFGFWLLVYDFNGIRQGLSVAFLGLATYHTYKQNLYKYLLFVGLAISFHYSSLVFLPFYFLVHLKLDKVGMFIIIGFIFIFNLFDLSKYVFSFFMDGSGGYFSTKTSAYSSMEEYNSNALFSFGVIHRFVIFLFTLFTVEKIIADKFLQRIFLMAAFLNFATYLMLSSIELIAVRGSLGFRYIECIYFSYIPFLFKNKLLQQMAGFILLLYVLFQIAITLSSPDGNLVPYHSVFG